jgi:putative hemolysin
MAVWNSTMVLPITEAGMPLGTGLHGRASERRLHPGHREIKLTAGRYRARLAASDEDRASVYRLRFRVFNLELNEGLSSAYQTGEDRDEYDPYCDHLIVEDARTGLAVGTYRLQSGESAAENIGYYSAREFDFSPYERLRGSILELGRACVHRDHRSFEVLSLLWRAIVQYAKQRRLRYMIGCSSLISQDPKCGTAMYHRLQDYLVDPELRTVPTQPYSFSIAEHTGETPKPPKLLRAYLSIGARICGPPAMDVEFGTIDFLTFMDLQGISAVSRCRFLR